MICNMTTSEGNKFLRQCRLCRTNTGELMEIFGNDGSRKNLANKINQCLPILVQEDDLLPKLICLKCVRKLEMVHCFRKACVQSELVLEANLKEQQAFPLEPECCLKEVELEPPRHLVEKLARSGVETIPQPNVVKDIAAGWADIIITPVDAETSVTDKNSSALNAHITPEIDVKEASSFSHIRQPGPDDYVLMKEETFILNTEQDNHRVPSNSTKSFIEFHKETGSENDKDIVQAQQKRREILPEMWDVYEKCSADNKNVTVTHRRYIISKSAFPCSLCGKCFKINQSTCSEGDGKYQKRGLDNKNVVSYSCHVCGKLFPQHSPLKRHLRIHLDYKLYACKLCGKAFNRKEHLSRHMISHVPGPPYYCDICNKPFTTKECLSQHRLNHPVKCEKQCFSKPLQNTPEGENSKSDTVGTSEPSRPFACETCGQGFGRKEHLIRHQKRMHCAISGNGEAGEEFKPYSCLMCSKNFTRKEHLVRHQNIHIDYKLYTCKLCGKAFSRKEHLSRHMISHTGGRPYHCDICNKPFTRKEHLSRHRLSHPVVVKCEQQCSSGSPESTAKGDKSQNKSFRSLGCSRSFICNYCGQSFDHKEHLTRHQKQMHCAISDNGEVSEETKPYTCVVCNKSFTRKEYLVRHHNVHLRDYFLGNSQRIPGTDISLSVIVPN